MPRPPPSDRERLTTLADRDVASSNSTLNTLLGRQKSWMVGHHGDPVRPTPRPPPSSVQKSAAAAVLPSPAPSDEPSPVMSHTQDSPTIDTSQLETRASIPATYDTVIAQPQRTNTATEIQRPPSHGRATNAPSTQPARWTEYGQTNSAQAQGPRETFAQLRNEIQTHAPSPQESQTHPSPDVSGVMQQQSRNTPSQRPSPIIPPLQYTSHAQRPINSPTVLSTTAPQAQGQRPQTTFVQAPSAHSSNHQRTRSQPVSLRSRLPLLEAHVASIGNPDLNETLEGPRLVLLTDACKEEDMFYVALHQIFCTWSLKRGDFPVINGLPKADSLSSAFTIIGTFLRTNDGLGTSELKWFSDFPSPLEDLIRMSESYRQAVVNVGVFLGRLVSEFHSLEKQCAQRGYPPLMNELVERLGLFSTVLQAVVSRFIRRNLGFGDDEIGFKVQRIFEQDKHGHYELSARVGTDRPPMEKEIRQHQANITSQYLALYRDRLARRFSSANSTASPNATPPTPVLPSNGYSQQLDEVSSTTQASPDFTTYSTLGPQNVQTQNFQSLAHQMQASPLLNGFLNLSTNPGSVPSPNMNGQQVYANTGSPTVQTVNSPVQAGFQWAPPVVRSNNSPVIQNASAYHVNAQNPGQTNQVVENLRRQQQQQIRLPSQQIYRPQYSIGNQGQQQSHLQHQQQASNQQGQQQIQYQQVSAQEQQIQLQRQALNQRRAMQQQQNQFLISQQAAQQQQQRILNQQNWTQQQYLPQQQIMAPQPTANTQQEHQIRQQVLAMNRAHAQQTMATRNSSASPGLQSQSRNNGNLTNTGRMLNQQNGPTIGTFPASRIMQQAVPVSYPNLTPQQLVTQFPFQRPLVPPTGFVYPAQHPNPDATALHQAHLRSPRLTISGSPADSTVDEAPGRFYQAVKEFAIKPTKLVTAAVCSFSFILSDAQWALMVRDKIVGTQVKRTTTRVFKCGSLQYRLRCVRSKPDTTEFLPQDWIVSETTWPPTVFLDINGHPLEIRRKIQHGKDLPIDVTRYIKDPSTNEENIVKVSMPRSRKTAQDGSYFFAVEVIEVLDHKTIMDKCLRDQRIPESQTLDGIKKSLAGPPDNDDEISMVATDLSIDLADPFTARIFETPVRGNSCLHRECFDLGTFLLTRNSKRQEPGQPCMVDVWKCPLCGYDARPYSLRVDEFLMSVRAELAKQDKLGVKAILIAADGSWKPKPEPESLKRKSMKGEFSDSDSEDEQPQRKKVALAKEKKKEPEVIKLDSD